MLNQLKLCKNLFQFIAIFLFDLSTLYNVYGITTKHLF